MVTPRWLACAGEVGGGMVILLLGFEGGVAEVAPEDGGHAEVMGHFERPGHFDDLAGGFGDPK
jgi:hypothetical protein